MCLQGHDISQIPCTYCHRNVNDIDAVWCEGVPYHDQCHKLSISNELKSYQKKVSLGTITLAESKRVSELEGLLNLIRDSDKRPSRPSVFKSNLLSRSGMPVFFSNERRRIAIESTKACYEHSRIVAERIRSDKLLCEQKGVEYNSFNLAKIESELLIAEKNNNTLISTAENSEKTSEKEAQNSAIFTPPKNVNG